MNRYGLMYNIEGSNLYVVPDKLPKKMPYEKWEFEDEVHMRFIYSFDQFRPKGIMSRLIVKLHKYIVNQDLVWHRGVNLEYENTYAEIIETYTNNNDFVIRVSGYNPKGLLAIIVDKFDEIISIYKNLNVEKMIQCNCIYCINHQDSHFFKYSDLLKRSANEISEVECEKKYEKVSVNSLLDGITQIEGKTSKAGSTHAINIFLASSSELKSDREKIEIFINRENNRLIKENIFLRLHVWEDFLDAMSQTRLQDEYNLAAINSDIFISLFGTKVGKYTKEEFTKAYDNFIKKGKPKYIYTYFKNIKTSISKIKSDDFQSLTEMKGDLDSLGHFYTNYEDENDLLRQLKNQLDKILYEEE